MSKKLLILAAWLLTAVATFALGWALKPAETAETVAQSVETQEIASVTPSQRRRSESAVKMAKQEAGILAPYLKGGTISAQDMGAAMKAVADENDPLKKAALFSALLEQLTPENAKAAFDALRESRGQERGPGRFGRGGVNEMALVLNAWGRLDGEAAIAELTALREAREAEGGEEGRGGRGGFGGFGGDGGMMDFMSALSGWATTDAEKAYAYVSTLDEGREQQMLTAGILDGVLLKGVDEAMAFVVSLPQENESRGRYMTMIAGEVLGAGIEAAKSWVNRIDDDSLKGGALTRVADEYAREDLQGAIDWAKSYAGEDYADGAVRQVAGRWAESDPQAVLEWGANLPESAQAGVFAEALNEWTETDPVAASEYLANMGHSPAKDAAVQGFANELAREDPQSAIVWAETIADEQMRIDTLTRVAQSYYRSDQAAAQAWLESSGLPSDLQEEIIEGSQRRGFGRDGFRGRGGR